MWTISNLLTIRLILSENVYMKRKKNDGEEEGEESAEFTIFQHFLLYDKCIIYLYPQFI